MIVHPNFLDHWKTRKLEELLEDPLAPIYVLRLWFYCQSQRTGEFDHMTDDELGEVCYYKGNLRVFRDGLETCRFIIPKPTGSSTEKPMGFIVNDWETVNAMLLRSWSNGMKGGRPSKTEKPTGFKTHGLKTHSNTKSTSNSNRAGFPKNPVAAPEEPRMTEAERAQNHQKIGQMFGQLARQIKERTQPTEGGSNE
jgi:hypothetical protein